MPIIFYKADDGAEEERFEFEFGRMKFAEVASMEKLSGRNRLDYENAYWTDNFEVLGYLLLTMMRRTQPDLTMEQLDLMPAQIVRLEVTKAERDESFNRILRSPDLTDEQRAAVKAVRDADAGAEVAEDPKATAPDA